MAAELNLYKRFISLFPAPAVDYGQVVSGTAESVTVELFQGGLLTVPTAETWPAESWVWIRRDQGVWSISAAPALATVMVEV